MDESASKLFKSYIPLAIQSQIFWGLIFQGLVLETGMPDVEYKLFVLQGEALGFEFSPDCMALLGWGLW